MDFRAWCLHHFPGGSFSGDTYSCKNVFRGEQNASLSITEHNQKWFDHGTGEGGDVRFFCREHGIESWAGVEPWKESLKRKDAPEPDAKPTEADARAMWEGSVPVESHPYLDKKGLSGEGLRITTKEWRHYDGKTPKGTLLIPARDIDGVLHGVERILPDGKLHLGRKTRCFFGDAPEPGKPFLLAEGYATACAIRRLSGWPTAEAFGFACLENAAKAVIERHPGIEVVLCPDRINEESQRPVIARLKEKWTVLELPDERPKNHDWDDEVRQYGLEAAKETFRARWSLAREKAPSPKKPVKWEPQVFTATDLYKADLAERVWAVDDLVPAGLSVLASPPKMGKSWMALQMCLAVASGKPFLEMKTHKGAVLYVSLEDSPLRLRKRIAALVGDKQDIPANLHLMTELPRLDKGGMEFLEGWIQANKPRLVCLDTWGKVKPGGDAKKNAFDADYSTVAEIKMTADRYAVALNLVHHLKKGGNKEADFLESLNGSMGLPAAADAILALKRTRGENTAILQRSGRDIEHDDDLALTWEAPGWKAESVSVAEVRMSEERRDIIKVIRDAGEPVSSSYVAESLGKNRSTTKNLIRKMVHEGVVNVSSRGQYYIPSPEREKNDDDESVVSVVSVVPVVRCSPRSLRSPDGPETTADYGVVQSVVQSESSTDAGLEAVFPAWTTQTTADYDKGQNFSEVKRMGPDELVFLPCEKPGSGSLPRVESEPAYDPFAVLGL